MIETNLLGTVASNSGYETGQMVGRFLVVLLFGGGAVHCFLIARRPATNAKCTISLGLLLCSIMFAGLIGIVARHFPALRILSGLVGLAALAGILAAVVLAIVGLVEYGTQKGKYTQGRAQAIWTLSLAAFFLICTTVVAIRLATQRLAGNMAMNSGQPTAGQWLTFEDLNFKVQAPRRPWVQMDAKKINKSAAVAFMQPQPEVFFVISVEKTGLGATATTEMIVELAKANLRSRMDSAKILSEKPVTHHGLDGVEMDSDCQTQTYDFFYRHWFCVTNGYAYQLMAWGRIWDAAAVRERTEELFSGFQVIDLHRQAGASMNGGGDFHSELFGYRVKMGGIGVAGVVGDRQEYPGG